VVLPKSVVNDGVFCFYGKYLEQFFFHKNNNTLISSLILRCHRFVIRSIKLSVSQIGDQLKKNKKLKKSTVGSVTDVMLSVNYNDK